MRDPGPNDRLRHLLLESWRAFDQLHAQDFVVRPALPILFFGDSNRYFASALRVVTVGLNPSKAEFPNESRLRRFPAAAGMPSDPDGRDLSRHCNALNAYFREDPYSPWFNSFEPILNGLGASYYDNPVHANTALHTDLCSPIATDPTWTKLLDNQRSLLKGDGLQIWHALIEICIPDIVVISVAERYLEQITFPIVSRPQAIWELPRKQPYSVIGTVRGINSEKRSHFVFGRAAQTPFGTISNAMKKEMGVAIKEWYDGSR